MRKSVILALTLFLITACFWQPSEKLGRIVDVEIVQNPPYYHGDTVTLKMDYEGISSMKVYMDDTKVYEGSPRKELDVKLYFGDHTLKVVGYDEEGNEIDSYSMKIKVHDPTPPSIEMSYSPTNPTDSDDVKITMRVEDGESGVRKFYIKNMDTGETFNALQIEQKLEIGLHTFMGYAENNDGKSSYKMLKIEVSKAGDDEEPTIDLEVPEVVNPGDEIDGFLHVEDEGGLKHIAVYLNSEIYREFQLEGERERDISFKFQAPNEEGTLSIKVSAEDLAGNEADRSVDIRISRNDPPSVSISANEMNPTVGESILISVEASDSDLKSVKLYLGDELLREEDGSFDYGYVADSDGLKIFTAVAVDSDGLESKDTLRILVGEPDTIPPIVKFSPPNKLPVNRKVKIFAFVRDNVKVAKVNFIVEEDGSYEILDANFEGGSVYSANVEFETIGEHRITVVASDTSGNESEISKVVSVVSYEEYISPDIEMYLYPKILNMEETLHVSISADDPDGLSRADFYVDDEIIDSKPFGDSRNLDFSWTATMYGEHVAHVVVYDSLGNSSEASETFFVVTERPSAKFTSPRDGSEFPYSEGMKIPLMVKVLDTSSSVFFKFDVVGPVSTSIEAVQGGEAPNYIFSADWDVKEPGEYVIRFSYTNSLNISTVTSIDVVVKDMSVIFVKPSMNYQNAGVDMDVEILSAPAVESGNLVLVKPDNSEHAIPLEMSTREDGMKVFRGVVPAYLLDTLTNTFSYVLKFTAVSGSIEAVFTYPFRVVDTLSPRLDVSVDGSPVVDSQRIELMLYTHHTLTVSASDNYRLDRITVYKDSIPLLSDSRDSVSIDLDLNPLENSFRIVAQDTNGNSTSVEFVIFAKESNPPVATPSNVDLIPVEGTVLNINEQTDINYGDFELEDDTELERVYYTLDGPMGYHMDGILWQEDGVRYTRISVDRTGNFSIKVGGIPGFYTLELKAVDIFGNETLLGRKVIEVRDLVPPVVNVEIDDSEIEKYHDGYPVISGNGIVMRVYAVDNLESISKIGLVVEDESGSVVSMESPDFPGNYYTFSLDTFEMVDGILKITGVATTSSGKDSSSTIFAVLDNFKNPYITLELPSAETYNGYPVYSKVINLMARISSISVPYDISKVILFVDGSTAVVEYPDGGIVRLSIDTTRYDENRIITISASVVDDAGNVSEGLSGINTYEVVFDNTAPVPDYRKYDFPDSIVTDSNIATIDFLENTAISGILMHVWRGSDEIILSVDNGNATVVSEDQIQVDLGGFFTSESTANYEFYSYDIAGNVGVGSGTFYYDLNPPVGTITSVEGLVNNIVTVEGATLIVEMEDSISWVSKLRLSATDTNDNSYEGDLLRTGGVRSGSTPLSWMPFESSEGTALLKVELFDPVDHVATASTAVRYDTLPPRITSVVFEDTITHPDYPDLVFSSETQATLTVDGTDMNYDSMEITVRIGNNVAFTDGSNSIPYTTSFSLSGDAVHTVEVTLRDLVGQATLSVSTLVCDVSSPTISKVILTDLTTEISTELYDGSTISLNSTEMSHVFTFRVEFDEPYPDIENLVVDGSDTAISFNGDTDMKTYKTFVMGFSTDDTLTIYVPDVVGHYATWTIYVDAP